MKPASAKHRVDGTAKALAAEAKRLGVEYAPLGGTVDGVLWLGHVSRLVDFKSPGGALTDSQAKLVARGCPVSFISTVPQLEALVSQMRHEARR